MHSTPFICATSGIQYEPSPAPPESCPVCNDERQYTGAWGQSWTTLSAVRARHKNLFERIAPHLYAIYTTPAFGIGQRAHLLITPEGNLLWDCITNLDATTIELIQKLGGLRAIAISHPHYYTTMQEWSAAFGDIPVYTHALDAGWLGRRFDAQVLWEGAQRELWNGMRLVCCGGHFPGASVLYQPVGKGRLFSGDTVQVAPNRKTVSFMYSYPNMIPLRQAEILQIRDRLKGLDYDAIYGAFGLYIREGARKATDDSIDRYLQIYR